MSYSVPFPLDDGFLRRECPECTRQFKWHAGPTEGRPEDFIDPPVYWCPYCAATATPDGWFTPEQVEFGKSWIAGPVLRDIIDEFNRDARRNAGGFLSMSMSYKADEPRSALHETGDMITVEPPCHPFEPIKVDGAWTEPLHCLVCGQPFALA